MIPEFWLWFRTHDHLPAEGIGDTAIITQNIQFDFVNTGGRIYVRGRHRGGHRIDLAITIAPIPFGDGSEGSGAVAELNGCGKAGNRTGKIANAGVQRSTESLSVTGTSGRTGKTPEYHGIIIKYGSDQVNGGCNAVAVIDHRL